MTEKNKAKQERKAKRKMWTGLYVRKTKTKREAQESQERKHKKRERDEQSRSCQSRAGVKRLVWAICTNRRKIKQNLCIK